MRFGIQHVDDEQVRFFINDREVGSVNHDEHGWAGMSAAESLFRAVALECGYLDEY